MVCAADRAVSGDVVDPQGTTPDFADALARLDHLRAHGPSERAFGWASLAGTRAWQSHGAPPVPTPS